MSFPSLTEALFFLFLCVLIWSLLGVKKKPGPRPDWSPLGVSFKISDEYASSFYTGVPPSELKIERIHPETIFKQTIKTLNQFVILTAFQELLVGRIWLVV